MTAHHKTADADYGVCEGRGAAWRQRQEPDYIKEEFARGIWALLSKLKTIF